MIALYFIVVAVAGLMGGVIGSIGLRDLEAVSFLGIITFQPTPFGLAMFGMLTIGTMLGVLLLLVVFVSRRYADG
ncbi:cox cluster protein [Natronomonas sp. CBA1123]|nr:cox cluster protein [Natronomonas sp. CBA1123]